MRNTNKFGIVDGDIDVDVEGNVTKAPSNEMELIA